MLYDFQDWVSKSIPLLPVSFFLSCSLQEDNSYAMKRPTFTHTKGSHREAHGQCNWSSSQQLSSTTLYVSQQAFRWFQPSEWIFLLGPHTSWREDKSSSIMSLSKFLTQRIHEHNTWVLYILNFKVVCYVALNKWNIFYAWKQGAVITKLPKNHRGVTLGFGD